MNMGIYGPVIAALLGAVVGAVITGTLTYFMQLRTERLNQFKDYRKMAMDIALAEWERRSRDNVHRRLIGLVPAIDFLIEYAPKIEGFLILSHGSMPPETLHKLIRQAEQQMSDFEIAYRKQKV